MGYESSASCPVLIGTRIDNRLCFTGMFSGGGIFVELPVDNFLLNPSSTGVFRTDTTARRGASCGCSGNVSSARVSLRRSSRLEESLYLAFYRHSGILPCAIRPAVPENEVIAEIAPILVNNPFRLGFMALIVGPDCMKGAIQAAVKVRSAKKTGLPPAHGSFIRQALQARMASFHLSPHRPAFPLDLCSIAAAA